jgi:hypothetical protein
MDDLIERIESARADADWYAGRGDSQNAVVTLSIPDCDAISKLLTAAFGCALTGNRHAELAERLAILSGAFAGDGDDQEAA